LIVRLRTRCSFRLPCAPAPHRHRRWCGPDDPGAGRESRGRGIGADASLRQPPPPPFGGTAPQGGRIQRPIYTGVRMLEGSRKPANHCHAFETFGDGRRRNVSHFIFKLYSGIWLGVKAKHVTKDGMACRRETCHSQSTRVYTMANRCRFLGSLCRIGECEAMAEMRREMS
jgi:hypothetical protein